MRTHTLILLAAWRFPALASCNHKVNIPSNFQVSEPSYFELTNRFWNDNGSQNCSSYRNNCPFEFDIVEVANESACTITSTVPARDTNRTPCFYGDPQFFMHVPDDSPPARKSAPDISETLSYLRDSLLCMVALILILAFTKRARLNLLAGGIFIVLEP